MYRFRVLILETGKSFNWQRSYHFVALSSGQIVCLDEEIYTSTIEDTANLLVKDFRFQTEAMRQLIKPRARNFRLCYAKRLSRIPKQVIVTSHYWPAHFYSLVITPKIVKTRCGPWPDFMMLSCHTSLREPLAFDCEWKSAREISCFKRRREASVYRR